jgi:hypothetical protein
MQTAAIWAAAKARAARGAGSSGALPSSMVTTRDPNLSFVKCKCHRLFTSQSPSCVGLLLEPFVS